MRLVDSGIGKNTGYGLGSGNLRAAGCLAAAAAIVPQDSRASNRMRKGERARMSLRGVYLTP